MSRNWYMFGHWVGRFIFFCTIRLGQIRPEIARREGAYILAVTHLGHLDPFCTSVIVRKRVIRWMTRKEFYCCAPLTWLLGKMGTCKVNRQGIPVGAIRQAIALARDGQVVGICPEGRRVGGASAAIRGGAIKQGICSIAIHAGVPVVPVVMLGTHRLSSVWPWLPFKWAWLRVAYGQPIMPPAGPSTRASRSVLRRQISESYVALYAELRTRYGISDQSIG